MPPPMIRAFTLVIRLLDDADFVADFGAAQDRDERLFGMLQCLAQIFEFLLHQQAGGGTSARIA